MLPFLIPWKRNFQFSTFLLLVFGIVLATLLQEELHIFCPALEMPEMKSVAERGWSI